MGDFRQRARRQQRVIATLRDRVLIDGGERGSNGEHAKLAHRPVTRVAHVAVLQLLTCRPSRMLSLAPSPAPTTFGCGAPTTPSATAMHTLIVDSVADGAWCGGVVLGSICKGLSQTDSRSIVGELAVNGEMRARGISSAVMGNPVLAVAWLANKLAEFGEGLEEGHIVMSGSFTGLIPVRSESSIAASFGTLGDVRFQISQ
jgi:hypothetical protein